MVHASDFRLKSSLSIGIERHTTSELQMEASCDGVYMRQRVMYSWPDPRKNERVNRRLTLAHSQSGLSSMQELWVV